MVEWKHINWSKLERYVYKLQKRIYRASQRGDTVTVRKLQKLLMKSWSAKVLAVRRVTQDNTGKKTAGVDGVKSLTPKQRLELANKLRLGSKSRPVRRVLIPKPGREEKRPLGIPTMNDRALQALVKLALEPEWEARFEPNSYGFRPGRSCQDAIEAIFKAIKVKAKKDIGLELKPSKTRLAHTLNRMDNEEPGFNFLGFNICQHLVSKYNSGRNPQGYPLGFKTIITPSKEKVKTHLEKIAEVIDRHKAAPQKALILHLNPIIRGWSNYYANVVSKDTYSRCDHHTYLKLFAWAKRRHPRKNRGYIQNKYWKSIGDKNWAFATREDESAFQLLLHTETPIVRHVKVKGDASPYDGNLIYWSKRRGKHPLMPKRESNLLKRQKGKCPHCRLYFREEDVLEVDHIVPKSKGGKDIYNNLQLLHRHCHDTKTANDGSLGSV